LAREAHHKQQPGQQQQTQQEQGETRQLQQQQQQQQQEQQQEQQLEVPWNWFSSDARRDFFKRCAGLEGVKRCNRRCIMHFVFERDKHFLEFQIYLEAYSCTCISCSAKLWSVSCVDCLPSWPQYTRYT
jgi:hypothetical protein